MASRMMSTPLWFLVAAALASTSLATSNYDDVHARSPVQTVWEYHGAGHRLYGSRRLTSNSNPYGSYSGTPTKINVSATVTDVGNFNEIKLVEDLTAAMGVNSNQVVATTKYKIEVAYSLPNGVTLNSTVINNIRKNLATSLGVSAADIRNLQSRTNKTVNAAISPANLAGAVNRSQKTADPTAMNQALTESGVDAEATVAEKPKTSVTVVFEVAARFSVEAFNQSEMQTISSENGLADIAVALTSPEGDELDSSAPQGGIAVAVAAAVCIAAIAATEFF